MRGRNIRVPRSEVRPTQDRVREALFSSLYDFIANARVLDLFAGSGAVGLEALSRGAASVLWVESNPGVFKVLKNNVDTLLPDADNGGVMCIKSDVFRFIKGQRECREFDLVFADPPYHKKGQNITSQSEPRRILEALADADILADDGIVVIEQGADEALPDTDGWELIRNKRYGGSRLLFFRQIKEKNNEH